MSRVILNDKGIPQEGDGDFPLAVDLHLQQTATVHAYVKREVLFSGDPRELEERIAVRARHFGAGVAHR